MTTVTITESEKEKIITIESKGHSGYSTAGTDIVCAGISTLMYSWYEYCLELVELEEIELRECVTRDGYMKIKIYDPTGKTLSALSLVKIGFRAIHEKYFENFTLKWGEKNF